LIQTSEIGFVKKVRCVNEKKVDPSPNPLKKKHENIEIFHLSSTFKFNQPAQEIWSEILAVRVVLLELLQDGQALSDLPSLTQQTCQLQTTFCAIQNTQVVRRSVCISQIPAQQALLKDERLFACLKSKNVIIYGAHYFFF
jgi:hypothetical protein